MGVLAWIPLGMAAVLPANVLLPAKDYERLYSAA
jgi:hypothetical protein